MSRPLTGHPAQTQTPADEARGDVLPSDELPADVRRGDVLRGDGARGDTVGRESGGTASAGLVHRALVFSSDEEFVAGTLPLLQQGIDRGDPAIVVTTSERVALLRDALGGQDANVDFVDNATWYDVPAWTLGEYHRYLQRRIGTGQRLWAVGELVWSGLTEVQAAAWHRYESLINVAFADAPVSAVCPYDARVLDPSVIAEVHATHPAVSGARGPAYTPPAEYTARRLRDVPPPPLDAVAVPFTVDGLSATRCLVATWAKQHGFTESEVRDISITVHEVMSNAVEHGGGGGVALFWQSGQEYFCEVTSTAAFDDPYPGYIPPDTVQERGRGLWMTRQVCREVDIVAHPDGGVRVRMMLPGSCPPT